MHVSIGKKLQTNYHPVCEDGNGINLPVNQTDLSWEEEYTRNI